MSARSRPRAPRAQWFAHIRVIRTLLPTRRTSARRSGGQPVLGELESVYTWRDDPAPPNKRARHRSWQLTPPFG